MRKLIARLDKVKSSGIKQLLKAEGDPAELAKLIWENIYFSKLQRIVSLESIKAYLENPEKLASVHAAIQKHHQILMEESQVDEALLQNHGSIEEIFLENEHGH